MQKCCARGSGGDPAGEPERGEGGHEKGSGEKRHFLGVRVIGSDECGVFGVRK